jgi:hypothetical protein
MPPAGVTGERQRHAAALLLAADGADALGGAPEADYQFVAFDGGEDGFAEV